MLSVLWWIKALALCDQSHFLPVYSMLALWSCISHEKPPNVAEGINWPVKHQLHLINYTNQWSVRLSYVSAGCTDTPHHVNLRDGVDAGNIQAHSHSNWPIYKRQKAKLNSHNCSSHCNYVIMSAVICPFLAVKTSVKEVEYRDVISLRSVILLHRERFEKPHIY